MSVPLVSENPNESLAAERRLEVRVRRHFMDGVRHFRLIEPGDHILLGLSGGKDSLALLELLGTVARNSGGRFRVSALHVRMENVDYLSDTGYLCERAAAVDVPLYVETTGFRPDENPKRSPCFLCAWHRRKRLFETAQRMGCNKIAFGHHQDDILLTALMNLTYSGSFDTMPAKLAMRKFPVTLIRPLCMVPEKELVAWAGFKGYRPVEKVCPYDKVSVRTSVRKVFDMQEQLNPEFRYSLWHALWKEGKLGDRVEE